MPHALTASLHHGHHLPSAPSPAPGAAYTSDTPSFLHLAGNYSPEEVAVRVIHPIHVRGSLRACHFFSAPPSHPHAAARMPAQPQVREPEIQIRVPVHSPLRVLVFARTRRAPSSTSAYGWCSAPSGSRSSGPTSGRPPRGACGSQCYPWRTFDTHGMHARIHVSLGHSRVSGSIRFPPPTRWLTLPNHPPTQAAVLGPDGLGGGHAELQQWHRVQGNHPHPLTVYGMAQTSNVHAR
jgi:hypothetical protein